jgi:hypothetical protein
MFLMVTIALSVASSPNSFADPNPTCWQTLLQLAPDLPSDFSCVSSSSRADLNLLCTAEGINLTNDFVIYLALRAKYLAAQARVNAWQAANPGAPQVPPEVYAPMRNAEVAWQVAGKKSSIEDSIESIEVHSRSCK